MADKSAAHEKAQELQLEHAIPEGYQGIDPVLESHVRRKIDRHLVPLVMALYLVSFLDRSNIGNAKTAGMTDSLNMSDDQYEWLLTLFYIPYILFEPLALAWKLIPPHRWAFICAFIWGVASICQAAAVNWSGMMACRFFMAVAEAGYGPGIPFLLSFFYKRRELGLRCGIFMAAAPLATCFAGALAYGITSGHPSIDSWRLLFIVEGAPSILMAFVAFFFLPDSPEQARFLTAAEKEVGRARAIQQSGSEGTQRVGSIDFRHVGEALCDIKNWLTALMYFSCNVSFSSLPVFLPTILDQMGYTSIDAQGLTAPPYFLAAIVCVASTFLADRIEQRGLVVIGLSLMGGVGYILLATVESDAVRYFGVFLAASGVFPSISNILPWVLNNQGSDTKRGMGIVILNVVGQCGPILGTRLYPAAEGPYFVKGMSVCAAFMFFNAVLAVTLRQYLIWQNKKADAHEQSVRAAEQDEKMAPVAEENEGYGFRYIL